VGGQGGRYGKRHAPQVPVHTLEEEEENIFANKAGCHKGLQPISAGYHTHNKMKNTPHIHKHYVPKQLNQSLVSKH